MTTKTLIIAEKPSVAGDLTKVLPGKFTKSRTHYESDTHVVSYAVGHLVTICHPEEIDERYKPWKLENLPILPENFPLKEITHAKGQLSALRKLICRKDIDTIINACDAGREGELIFKYILQYTATQATRKKTVKRLWLQSMTKNAIQKGFENLRDDSEMLSLEQAALCRSESDWLIGINASRALTAYKSRMGGFFLTPCGRVQTPTLSIIVRREQARKDFKPTNYWELHGDFAQSAGNYLGKWFNPDFKKKEATEHQKADRLWTEKEATDIAEKCKGKPAQVTETQKPSSQLSSGLYDLTTLQREANSRFGFSARNTLGLAQALYERHKLLTYPRTDSRCLPEDYIPTCSELMGKLSGGDLGKFAQEAIDKGYVKPNKRIFNDKKISDHHAIIPTGAIPKGLSEPEEKIYTMVTQRFLAVFFPAAKYLNTKLISVVESENFLTEGKVLEYAGWRAIYGVDTSGDSGELAPLSEPPKVTCDDVEIKADATRPPARFSEATLLSAMEHSDRYVDDDELKEALKERGLGTPATRAAIIEGLISDKYIVREARELMPTGKAFDLMALIVAMDVEELASPELTGEWEYKLAQVMKGSLTRESFMQDIRDLTSKIISRVRGFDEEGTTKKEAAFSPLEGITWFELLTRYESEDGKYMIRKILGGRQMEESEVIELVTKRTLGPMDGFRSKRGKPFNATLKINDQNKVEFIFANSNDFSEEELTAIFAQEPLGLSPIDQSPVYETPASYVCKTTLLHKDDDEEALKEKEKKEKEDEKAKEGEADDGKKPKKKAKSKSKKIDNGPGLRINKIILGKTLEPKDISKMLTDGKTDLIKGFRSSKTKRLFDAFLILNPKGQIKFDFPPRAPRGKKKATAEKSE